MAGVDKVIADGYADSDRMFVAGCSGGGILTTWIIGQTNRFKAAAALKIRGIPSHLIPMSNEYHGTGSIPSNYLRTNLMMRKWFDEFDPIKIAVSSEIKAKN